MIGIIDYGLGNIHAFTNMYKRMNVTLRVVRSPAELSNVCKIILPGVGAFDHAMDRLNQSGFRPALDELVLEGKMPVLGVCVGMQMLADSSAEGCLSGLGWIPGAVKRLELGADKSARLPHMGWNDILPVPEHPLFRDLTESPRFYFLHSYYFVPAEPVATLASVDYGTRFTCAVGRENVMGVQFHPEKSHGYGAKLLMNFAAL